MIRPALLFALAFASAACARPPADDAPAAPATATFRFTHPTHDEYFVARTADPEIIAKARAELAKPLADRSLHINGVIAKGSGEVNAPWSWHFVEGEWTLAEMSIELCDGWPGYIEDNLDKWLAEVGFFCPWSSRVEAEID
ncbi:MAG: hypothetical protein WD076_08930 [Parvularculaceae bacterium]